MLNIYEKSSKEKEKKIQSKAQPVKREKPRSKSRDTGKRPERSNKSAPKIEKTQSDSEGSDSDDSEKEINLGPELVSPTNI